LVGVGVVVNRVSPYPAQLSNGLGAPWDPGVGDRVQGIVLDDGEVHEFAQEACVVGGGVIHAGLGPWGSQGEAVEEGLSGCSAPVWAWEVAQGAVGGSEFSAWFVGGLVDVVH
jgi:hypothetical protein